MEIINEIEPGVYNITWTETKSKRMTLRKAQKIKANLEDSLRDLETEYKERKTNILNQQKQIDAILAQINNGK